MTSTLTLDHAARLALVANLAVTVFMTGLIWFVQVVHYPLFARVAPDAPEGATWRTYHAEHCQRTGTVVFGPMVVELLSSAWLALGSRPPILGRTGAWVGLGLTLATWGITGLLAVPAHDRLAAGFDGATHRQLLRADLVRALAWSVHSAILLAAIYHALQLPIIVEDR